MDCLSEITLQKGPEEQDRFMAILVMTEGEEENQAVWRFLVTEKEYQLLQYEFDYYNDWIQNILIKGLAPKSSYISTQKADELFLAKRMVKTYNIYDGEFERPGSRDLYEKIYLEFSLFREDEKDSDVEEDTLEKISEIKNSSFSELEGILTKPLGNEEIRIGYRIFPMTERIIKRERGF